MDALVLKSFCSFVPRNQGKSRDRSQNGSTRDRQRNIDPLTIELYSAETDRYRSFLVNGSVIHKGRIKGIEDILAQVEDGQLGRAGMSLGHLV